MLKNISHEEVIENENVLRRWQAGRFGRNRKTELLK